MWDWFHWPGMVAEVCNFCQQCPQCQKITPYKLVTVPLMMIGTLMMGSHFECLGMDLVGSLPKSPYSHVLVTVDYTTMYPEAITLHKATSKNIAHELMVLFS